MLSIEKQQLPTKEKFYYSDEEVAIFVIQTETMSPGNSFQ